MQLLLKNAGRLSSQRLLILGAPRDDAIAEAFGQRRGVLVTFDYGAWLRYEAVLGPDAALRPEFTADYTGGPLHDVAIIFLQKGSELNDYVAAMAGRSLAPGGTAFLVGENKAGIRSAAEVFERRIGEIVSTDKARHCALFEAGLDDSRIDRSVGLPSWERVHEVDAGSPGRLRVVSVPGVFSHGRLDAGTGFLLQHLPERIPESVLDFACGSGVIGAAIAARAPGCAMTLADSSAFALHATARTFEVNGLTAGRIIASDVFTGIDGEFDLIISNPPFHQGVETNYDTVSSFFAGCARRLRPGGQVIIVANRFLPYERQMAAALSPPAIVAENTRFKVLASRRRS